MENKRKNKDFNPYNYGVTHFMNLIGGKWKIIILYAISKLMPVNQLRELEDDTIIERIVNAEIPPRTQKTETA